MAARGLDDDARGQREGHYQAHDEHKMRVSRSLHGMGEDQVQRVERVVGGVHVAVAEHRIERQRLTSGVEAGEALV